MANTVWIVGLAALLGQVPPPTPPTDVVAELTEAARTVETREAAALNALASRLAKQGQAEAAVAIRRVLPAPGPRGGATRIVPLPEVVPARGQGLASVGRATSGAAGGKTLDDAARKELEKLRSDSAAKLFELARRAAAADPPRYALAGMYLRAVLEREPGHPEARRLLGYVPHEGGWARPFAVRQLRDGNVSHPVFGWVPEDWVPHLEIGELPAPSARGQRKVRWLPAVEADRLRNTIKNPWRIATEHFEVQTDVPLAEAIEFSRRLEAFYDLFFALMADVLGENLPLARRFHSPTLTGESTYRPHSIYYFATKDEYVDRLRPIVGPDIELSLGYYDPPKPGRGNRAPAYFFRDQGGQLPVTATLYHEVSHQLLFESAGPNAYLRNHGNYWVFEGLGTYFETVTPRPDGSVEVGGLVGERLEAARLSLNQAGRMMPLEQFIQLDQNQFNNESLIHTNYQQAMALTVFLMQRHRVEFLDYVRDAYRGRIKRTTGRTLQDRLGQPYNELDSQFRSFYSLARRDGKK